MIIEKNNLLGNTNVGVYIVATDEFLLHPANIGKKIREMLEQIFATKMVAIKEDISVIGTLILANEHGIVLSSVFSDDTLEHLIEVFPEKNVERLKREYYAIGNTGVTNDKKTILAPIIDKKNKKIIQDCLQTEVIQRKVGDSDLVGSLIKTTNKAAAVGPYVKEEEISILKNDLNIPKAEFATINRGYYFPASGFVVNKNGLLCGTDTTGIELARIADIFE